MDGVAIASEVTQGPRTLKLVGAGVRTKFVFRIYVAALYALEPSQDARRLIEGPGARRLHLQMLRDVDSATLEEAMHDELKANHSADDVRALTPAIERLSQLLKTTDRLHEGDTIDLEIDAGAVAILYNRQNKGRIDDPRLPAALMRVWLGDNPTQTSLKQALLGLR
ncbi:hypothetical protein AW878_08165 [Bordetella pseudohinzii]|uniref:Chalcone isomerase domain-containing protein n=1 Tax=Bordetella pseudohinzii TaxID=1331258 RepID=A0ABN4S083_9BORD|nr:hypothetical protein BBN53_15505 [Bordetella pseudohinzii]KMM24952.1 hypothetical protein L540_03755 [Bordetella pseudohinzii]KXA79161.1 hypothetical protein AW877_10215 [Bordetella pseudohinzii]KXA80285.1 hypothetical protein AW878_08165 [Bordetella pseudohinzii]